MTTEVEPQKSAIPAGLTEEEHARIMAMTLNDFVELCPELSRAGEALIKGEVLTIPAEERERLMAALRAWSRLRDILYYVSTAVAPYLDEPETYLLRYAAILAGKADPYIEFEEASLALYAAQDRHKALRKALFPYA